MEQQPFTVDIAQESEVDRKKEIWEMGDAAERKIGDGETVFLDEGNRTRLKSLVEGTGVDLSGIEGATNLMQQAEGLIKTLGKERTVRMIREIVVELLKSPGGDVLRKESPFVIPEEEERVGLFVNGYLGKEITGPFAENSWENKTIHRIEAVFSATNKLMWILGAENEEEGARRQGTEGIKKHLRERVIRGCGRGGDIIPQGIERYKNTKGETGVIRHLPKRGVGVILEHLTRV